MVKHVWFDMAGTLYEETPSFKAEHNKLKYVTYGKLVGQNDLDKAEAEYQALYVKYHSNSAVFQSLGMPSDYWQNKFDELDIRSLLTPDPKVANTLAEIKEFVPISLFSNFRLDQIESTLDHLGIPVSDFTYFLCGDDVPVRKPALDGFYKMMATSGLSADQNLYVGDRVEVDIKPAKRIGMKTCLVYSKSIEADYCVDTFPELTRVLRQAVRH
jgi:HAD superfamily hydrolase (TIGR01549 family)